LESGNIQKSNKETLYLVTFIEKETQKLMHEMEKTFPGVKKGEHPLVYLDKVKDS